MTNCLKWFWISVALVVFVPFSARCETYSQTIDFDQNQAYSWNINWKHALSQMPQGSIIESAQIQLRVQVWYWGWNVYEQNIDIMASDTTVF